MDELEQMLLEFGVMKTEEQLLAELTAKEAAAKATPAAVSLNGDFAKRAARIAPPARPEQGTTP